MPGPGPVARRRLLMRGPDFRFLSQSSLAVRILMATLRARWNGRLLRREMGPARPLRRDGAVAVVPYYGNPSMLNRFFDHHRRLGVQEFVFLDLTAERGLGQLLMGEDRTAVWRPLVDLDASRVTHWLNYLRGLYATGRWCLSPDMNDMLVYYRSETRQIGDLIEFLESENRDHIFAQIIEMYGSERANSIELDPQDDLLDKMCYFDPYGYATEANAGPFDNVIVRGGLQRRTLFASWPHKSPILSRIPLAKWARFTSYIAETQVMLPKRMNVPHSQWHSTPTACLLRFALANEDDQLEMAARFELSNFTGAFASPSYFGAKTLRGQSLRHEFSARFERSEDLVDFGLLNPGQWF
jgi:hypothetical protein